MQLAPCLPARLMPDAVWLRFLARHPDWTAPMRVAGPCVRVGVVAAQVLGAAVVVVPGTYPAWVGRNHEVPAQGFGQGTPGRPALAGAGPVIGTPIFPAEANRNVPAVVEGPAPFYPTPLALADLPPVADAPQAPTEVPEPASLALLGVALVLIGWFRG